MNSKTDAAGNATGVTTFGSLGQRMHTNSARVNVLKDAKTVDPRTLQGIRAMNGFDARGAALLRALDDAEQAKTSDPHVRYLNLLAEIAECSESAIADPELVLRLISLARAKTMPDKTTETRPVLVDFGSYKAAEAYAAENAGKHIRPLAMPVTYYVGEGAGRRLRMNGVRFCVPNGQAERQAFFQVEKMLESAAQAVIDILNDNYLFDLRLAAEWIVRTFRRAEIATKGYLEKGKNFKAVPGDDLDLFVPAYGKETVLRRFAVSDEEQLLLPNTDRNRAIVERMAYIASVNQQLRDDELGMGVDILRKVRGDGTQVVSPRQFLDGDVGVCAVGRDWKQGEVKIDVVVLFARRDDGAWRVALYNRAAFDALLTSKEGVGFRFTWFTNRAIPGHLETLLRTGTQIRTPEDIGLTEEDMLPPPAIEAENQPTA